MKGDKLYNVNSVLNKWEEDNYARLMARKIKGARTAITGAPTVSNHKGVKPNGKCANHSSGFSSNITTASNEHADSSHHDAAPTSQQQSDVASDATQVLSKLLELLQPPLLQQLQQLQLQLPSAKPTGGGTPSGTQPAFAAHGGQAAAIEIEGLDLTGSSAAGTPSNDLSCKDNVCSSVVPPETTMLDMPKADSSMCISQPAALSLSNRLQAAEAATSLLQGANSHQRVASTPAHESVTSSECWAGVIKSNSKLVSGRKCKGRRAQTALCGRGSSRGNRNKQQPRPPWDDHWFAKEPPCSSTGPVRVKTSSAADGIQQHQELEPPLRHQVTVAAPVAPATSRPAARCASAAAVQHQQKPRFLNKQCSLPAATSRPNPAFARSSTLSSSPTRAENIKSTSAHSAASGVSPSSQQAAQAALARLRQGTAAVGANSLRAPTAAAADAEQGFRVRLLPVKNVCSASTAANSACKQTCQKIPKASTADLIPASGSVHSTRESCSQRTVGTSYNTCRSPSRYSNSDGADCEDDDEQSPAMMAHTQRRPDIRDNIPGDFNCAALDCSAGRQAASPVDVLTTSLMTLNNLVRSQVQGLTLQQEQQQIQQHEHLSENSTSQHVGHDPGQGDMRLCSVVSLTEVIGAGVQLHPSELLVLSDGAAALASSDLAFLEQVSMGQQLPDFAAVLPVAVEQQYLQESSRQHVLQDVPVHDGAPATASWDTAAVALSAAVAAEEGDSVLLGTLHSSSTAAVGASGPGILHCLQTSDVLDTQPQRCQVLAIDRNQHYSVQQQQEAVIMCSTDAPMYAAVSIMAGGGDNTFHVCEYAANSDGEGDVEVSQEQSYSSGLSQKSKRSDYEDAYADSSEDDDEQEYAHSFSGQGLPGPPDVLQVTHQQHPPDTDRPHQERSDAIAHDKIGEDVDCGYLSGLEQSASGELHY